MAIKDDLKFIESDLDLTYFIDFNLDALLEALKKVSDRVDHLLKINSLTASLSLPGVHFSNQYIEFRKNPLIFILPEKYHFV